LDEAKFMIDKARKEGDFTIGLMKAQSDSAVRLMREELRRSEGERELLRAELGKMKAYFEAKGR
jgi:hypothetical protein